MWPLKCNAKRETKGLTGIYAQGLTFNSFSIEMITELRGSQVPIKSHNKTVIVIILDMIIK